MQKRVVKRSSFSVNKVPKLNPFSLKKITVQNNLQKSLPKSQVNPQVAKWTFVLLMVAIFFALFYQNPSLGVTSYSVADTTPVNPGLNLVIFLGLLALVFFLTYEKRKSKK